MKIVSLEKTCDAVPSQWEGKTDDGQTVYIRFRFGRLTVQVGDTLEDAVYSDPIFVWIDDDEWAGYMDNLELMQTLPRWIELP